MEQQLLGTPGVLLLTFIGTECKSRRWKHAVSAVWHCIYCAASYGNASRLQRGACHQEAQTGKPPFLKVVSTLLFFFYSTLNLTRTKKIQQSVLKRKGETPVNAQFPPSFANVWVWVGNNQRKTRDLLVIDMLADASPPGFRTLERDANAFLLEVYCIVLERPSARGGPPPRPRRLTELRGAGGRTHRK